MPSRVFSLRLMFDHSKLKSLRDVSVTRIGDTFLRFSVDLIQPWITNGWETRSRDVWKPVRNRTPGIISKICKLAGGTPAPVFSGLLGPYKISHGLIWGK